MRGPEADSQRERRANPDDRAYGEATQPASAVRRAKPCPALRARITSVIPRRTHSVSAEQTQTVAPVVKPPSRRLR
eukprot:scaffold42279_cov73-Phaeocystis_antarctica.AAC.2